MGIKKFESVVRDESGFWTHPEIPEWDEGVSNEVVASWFKDNQISPSLILFEFDANQELVDSWFDGGGECNCSEWTPAHFNPNAFLLSIHDTDDGPIALFAIPNDKDLAV